MTPGDEALRLMRMKGKTFALAARLLPRGLLLDAATLYAFCREVDDAADESADHRAARVTLMRLQAELVGEAPPRASVHALRQMAARRGVDLRYALELIDGCASDVGRVRVSDDAALERYAYLVAGTVGAMMQRLLGATDERALSPAIALGVGMQLTNICRDVREDARRDRIYLPADRLSAAGIAAEALLDGSVARPPLAEVIASLLARADHHYQRALEGLRYLPWRARLAVACAAHMYRAIGVRLLLSQGGDPLRGRVVVPLVSKLAAAAKGCCHAVIGGAWWRGALSATATTAAPALRGAPSDSRSGSS